MMWFRLLRTNKTATAKAVGVNWCMQCQRRTFSYHIDNPPRGAGEGRAGIFPGMMLASLVAGSVYIYYDPSILPDSLLKYLPLEKDGVGKKAMSPEEYEKWREQHLSTSSMLVDASRLGVSTDEENLTVEPTSKSSWSFSMLTGSSGSDATSKKDMKSSITNLIKELKKDEAQFKIELKKKQQKLSLEDEQQLQYFKEEREKLEKELQFIKKH